MNGVVTTMNQTRFIGDNHDSKGIEVEYNDGVGE